MERIGKWRAWQTRQNTLAAQPGSHRSSWLCWVELTLCPLGLGAHSRRHLSLDWEKQEKPLFTATHSPDCPYAPRRSQAACTFLS